jgi:hypothetical protein
VNDSTIIVKSPDGWKFKAAIGIFGLAVIVILAFLYRLEVGIIVLGIGTAAGARVWIWAIGHYRASVYQWRQLEAETKRLEYEADKARIARHFLETNSGVFHIRHDKEEVGIKQFYPAVNASRLLADVPQLALPEPAPRLRRLLDVAYIHLLIVGPSGSGKTTALCWLIDAAPPGTLIYALDPHAQFGEWPSRVNEIVGNGRDYQAIDAKLLDLISTLDNRYNGAEATLQKILIVADEWLSILDKCPSAREFFNVIGSEARKVNMSLVISSISATVDDLAVSGAIRDNLAQLTLNRTLKDRNQGELKWSRRDTELVELPGPYYRQPALPSPQPVSAVPNEFDPLGFDSGPVPPTPDSTELRIFELHQQGLSLRAISKEVYGSIGGRQVKEIQEILAKFGVSFGVSDAPGVS